MKSRQAAYRGAAYREAAYRELQGEGFRPRASDFGAVALAVAVVLACGAIAAAAIAQRASDGQAVCRVANVLSGGATNLGSGTLISISRDGRRGLVLTCAHLFSEGVGQAAATFGDGRPHGAKVLAVDACADLAALEIDAPKVAPAAVSYEIAPGALLRACGFGPNGEYRCAAGSVLGGAERPGQVSVRISGAVRTGDSGGGMFDEQGRLVAVVWGQSEGVTYASTGAPLQRFIARLTGGEANDSAATNCPTGRCPLVQPGGLHGIAPREDRPPQAKCACGCSERIAALDRESRQRHDSLLARLGKLAPAGGAVGKAAGTLAVTALGVSGPAGLAIVAGATACGWLIGRRVRRRAARPAKEEATAAAADSFHGDERLEVDVQQPTERDDVEARQLLRLSQLEGRDPLQDAVAGRLALDRLDAVAEGDADPQRAEWADELRRELRERFNEIAPTKFVAG